MNHKRTIFLSTLFTALVVGVTAYYFLHTTEQTAPVDVDTDTPLDEYPGDEPLVTTDTEPALVDTLSYYIPELGLRLNYPAYATVTAQTIEGITGSLISGSIRLSPDQIVPYTGKSISFGAMTEDFSWPKGCDGFCATGGYSKIGDNYYYGRKGATGSPINVATVIPLQRDGSEAIIILPSGEEGPGALGQKGIAAMVNTNSPLFPGISFVGSIDTQEDRALFESIIRSIEIE